MSSNTEILQERLNELENVALEYKDNKIHIMNFASRDRLFDYFKNNIKCFASYGVYENIGIDFEKTQNNAIFIIKNNDETYFRTKSNIYIDFDEFLNEINNTINNILPIDTKITSLPKDCYKNILAIDFETANEMHDKACSVGISLFSDGEIKLNKEFLINPETHFNKMNIDVHGITPMMVKDSPTFPTVWNEVKNFIDDNTLVIAHNAAFDITLLKKLMAIYKCDDIEFDYLCTHKLYRQNINLEKYNLKYVASYLNEDFEHHKALDDSLICLKAFLHLADEECKLSKSFINENLNGAINKFYLSNIDRLYTPKIKKTASFTNYANNFKPSDLIPKSTNFDESHPVYNKTFAFTGDLPSFDSKMDAAQKIVDLGGIYKGGVVKSCDYLVVGVDLKTGESMNGSKVQKAYDYNNKGCNIELISEYDLLMLLNSKDNSDDLDINIEISDDKNVLETENNIVDINVNNDVNISENTTKNNNVCDTVDVAITVENTDITDKEVVKKDYKRSTQMSMFDMLSPLEVTSSDDYSDISLETTITLDEKIESSSPVTDSDNFITPKPDFIKFETIEDKIEKLKQYKLVGAKASKIDKVFYYKGVFTNGSTPCEIIGYLDEDVLVIDIDGILHSIRGEYLKQMQDNTFSLFDGIIS